MRDENCRSRSCVVFTSSQRDAHRTLVDEYDFIFVQMLVGRNFVSWWHLLCPDDECVRAGAEGINFENERLVPRQHPTVTFGDNSGSDPPTGPATLGRAEFRFSGSG